MERYLDCILQEAETGRFAKGGNAMRYCEASQGRVFILSLDDGDMIPGVIEKFAEEKRVQRGYCMLLGGAQKGSKIVVGPVNEASRPVVPFVYELEGVHKVMEIGTIFPDEEGRPALHMHVSAGRNGKVSTGCSKDRGQGLAVIRGGFG